MKKIGKLIKTLAEEVKHLLSSGFLYIFCSDALNQLIRFSYSIFIVRIISKSSYGVFSYTMNIYNFFILLSGLGIDSAMLQVASEKSHDPKKTKSLFAFAYRFGFAVNALICVALVLTAFFTPLKIQASNALLKVTFALPLFDITRRLHLIQLRIGLKHKAFAISNFLHTILLSAFAILGAYLYQEYGMVYADYLTFALVLVIMTLCFNTHIPFSHEKLPKEEKRDILSLCTITSLSNGLTAFLTLSGTYLLGYFYPNEEMIASFRAAATIPTALAFVPGTLMIFVYPYFARERANYDWVIAQFKKVLLFLTAMCLPIALFGITLAPFIIGTVFGQEYLDSVTPFRILMLTFFFQALFKIPAGNLLVTQRKLKFNLFVSVLTTVMSTASNILLIPRYHSNGAAFSQLITILTAGAIATGYFTWHIYHQRRLARQAADEGSPHA